MGTLNGLINRALSEVGYLEKKSNSQLDDKTANAGSANYTKYGRDMHNLYPSVMDFPASWCDAFVDWLFYQEFGVANAKGLIGGNFDDYTPNSAQLYKNKGAWYTSNPKVGDQIFFKNSSRICHTGLVIEVTATHVITVEGNTSDQENTVIANGGCTAKKRYLLTNSRIAGYGRPAYDKFSDGKTTAPTVEISSVLKLGSRGAKVKELQENLNKLDYHCGTADGDFGKQTFNAVKQFQKDKGLECDGIVGNATKEKIKECIEALHKPANNTSSTVLSKYNENVLKGQKWLNANYSSIIIKATGKKLTEDGIFGSHSRNAALAVWKDVMNRKYDATFTVSNTNFGDSCKLFAKNALVKKGVSGTFTYLCQFLLAANNFYSGDMNAECGNVLANAIGKYQASKKLPCDNQCGANTWYSLFN